jgi:hypothetical protein
MSSVYVRIILCVFALSLLSWDHDDDVMMENDEKVVVLKKVLAVPPYGIHVRCLLIRYHNSLKFDVYHISKLFAKRLLLG